MLGWEKPGLPVLSNVAGPIQHFRAAVLNAGKDKVSADLCARKGFRVAPCMIFQAPCSSLTLAMFGRERQGAAKRCPCWEGGGKRGGGGGNGFLLGKVQGQHVPCGFCGAPDGDGHLFLECTFPPLVEFVKILSFMVLWRWRSLFGLGAY